MGYQKALEAAGATVHAFKCEGDYQGHWAAKVVLPSGQAGWILGYYGSCEGCDSYLSANIGSGYDDHKHDNNYIWTDDITAEMAQVCAVCAEVRAALAAFGEQYFRKLMSAEDAIKALADNEYAPELAAFVRATEA